MQVAQASSVVKAWAPIEMLLLKSAYSETKTEQKLATVIEEIKKGIQSHFLEKKNK